MHISPGASGTQGASWSRQHLSTIFQTIARWLLHVAAFASPLFFYRGLSDGLELPKLLLWATITLFVCVAWVASTFITGRLRKIPWSLGAGMASVLVLASGSAWFSASRFLSVVGINGQASFSLTALFIGVAWACLIAQVCSELNAFRLLRSFVAGVGVSAFLGLLNLLGSSLVGSWLGGSSATTLGSAYVLGVLVAVVIPLSSVYALYRQTVQRVLPGRETVANDTVFLGTSVVGFLFLLALGARTSFAILALGCAAALVVSLMHKVSSRRSLWGSVTLAGVLVSLVLTFFTFPWHADIPVEVSPNMTLSWMIAKKSLAQHPWFGNGLGTWSHDYLAHHPVEVNTFAFWDTIFDRSYNTFLTLLPTMGILGTVAWFALCVAFLFFAAKTWNEERANPGKALVFVGLVSLFGVQLVYHFSLPLTLLFWLCAGWVMRGSMHDSRAHVQGREAFAAHIPFLVAVVGCVCMLVWGLGRLTWSGLELAHGRSLFRAQGAAAAIPAFEQASKLAPWDPYASRTLGEAYVLRGLATMQTKPTSTLLAQAYADIQRGVETLVSVRTRLPEDVDTRLLLARTYRSLMNFTASADIHAIEMYEAAATLNPTTPIIPHEIGSLYLELGDKDRQLTQAGAANDREAARSRMMSNYAKAKQAFARALQLKGDYLPTRYMMGVVAEREGRIRDAITQLEGVLKQDTKNTGVAFELALLYAHNKDVLSAKTLLEQVVVVEPNDMNARWYLASLYEQAGIRDKAIEQLQWIASHGFATNAAVMQKLDMLKKSQVQAGQKPGGKLPDPLPNASARP